MVPTPLSGKDSCFRASAKKSGSRLWDEEVLLPLLEASNLKPAGLILWQLVRFAHPQRTNSAGKAVGELAKLWASLSPSVE